MADTPTTTPATAPTPAAATLPPASRGNRKQRVGEVISNRMAKTIIVRVERRFPHRKFKKVVTGYKQFYAHDEQRQAKVGDRVRIEETRPLSKTKRWRLVAVMKPGTGVTPGAG
ncbi:MAG: 30S ribosomal protein S17 [Verrucomicrobiota bacterium]|jgi:small subunit ribosomal protein S17